MECYSGVLRKKIYNQRHLLTIYQNGRSAHLEYFLRGKRPEKKTIWLPVVSGKMRLVWSLVRVPTCFHACLCNTVCQTRGSAPTLSLTICNKRMLQSRWMQTDFSPFVKYFSLRKTRSRASFEKTRFEPSFPLSCCDWLAKWAANTYGINTLSLSHSHSYSFSSVSDNTF